MQKGLHTNVLGEFLHVKVDVVIELVLLIDQGGNGLVISRDENFPLVVYQRAHQRDQICHGINDRAVMYSRMEVFVPAFHLDEESSKHP